jgi:hypothetical protein
LVSVAYSEYGATPVIDYAETFSTVTPLAKLEQHNNSRGCPSSQLKSYGMIEMMHLQMQQQAIQYQHDQEEKAEQEKHRLEELKEDHKEHCLEHQAMMMMFMAMRGADGSNINLKNDSKSD